MFTSTDAQVKHITEPKKGIPCKHYLRGGAVVFIDHRHKKKKKKQEEIMFNHHHNTKSKSNILCFI